MKVYRGGESLEIYSGMCVTDSQKAASHYGENVAELEIDLEGLKGEKIRVSDEDIENAEYPGDRAAQVAAYLAAGVDYREYNDVTERGYEHTCYRLLSAAALARVSQ